ncbi:MAG: phenylacetate--CoA ligase family protein [Bacteroidaceae bacterium]|nr:phenylacetate--CoA ligase family protein [Bacteroidaceae bacterium]
MKTIELAEAKRLVAEGGRLPDAERRQLQQQRLHELVAYVREHSPYFARHYANVPADFRLSDLPPTEKPTLLANYDDWVTDRRIHLADVLEYVNRDASKDQSRFLGDYTALRTSGSTGNPLPMVRDDYHNKIHGQLIGQRLLEGANADAMDISKHRRASLIHLSNGASSYGAFLRMKAAHPECADNLLGISVLESVDSIVEKLNAFQPETMAGYPSMMVRLAVEQLQGRLHLSLKHLATSAEMLSEENFHLLREAFQCPVANNYCMTEGGEIAMTHNCPHLHINDDWVIVEPIDKDGNLITDPDQWSDAILVTDLSNFVQPIIRYRVGDVVRVRPSTYDCSPLPILQIQGRSFDNYTICGQTFNVVGIFAKAEVWPDLQRFQFVQTDNSTIQVRGVCKTSPAEVLPSLCDRLKAFLAEEGCPDARFTWSAEPLIHNERGGKIPLYVKL